VNAFATIAIHHNDVSRFASSVIQQTSFSLVHKKNGETLAPDGVPAYTGIVWFVWQNQNIRLPTSIPISLPKYGDWGLSNS